MGNQGLGGEYQVCSFINELKSFNSIEDTFLNGFCYYFALMLQCRFGGEILYAPIVGHFVTRIGDRYYDVTGDVTDIYKQVELYDQTLWLTHKPIVEGCILHI